MRVIGRGILEELISVNREAKPQSSSWLKEVESCEWETPHDVKRKYASASFLGNGIVVFNIKGNRYRIVVHVDYESQIVRIRWAGNHKEYDKLNFKEG